MDELQTLYRDKGEATTTIEVMQNRLKVINKKIDALFAKRETGKLMNDTDSDGSEKVVKVS